MIFIENCNTDAKFNLALEEVLFKGAASNCYPGIVSLWRNHPSVIIGRYQNTAEEVNRYFIEENGVNIVRRMSGGGAVYHDLGNLNYTIIVPISDEADLSKFSTSVITALSRLGLSAELSGRNDITLNGKKISGYAQHISDKMLLHHGTLLFDTDLQALASALNPPPDKYESKAVKSVRARVANIKEYLNQEMGNFRIFADTVKSALIEDFGITDVRAPSEKEAESALRLAETKYNSWEWNWGRSPIFTTKLSERFPGGRVDILLRVENGMIEECFFRGDFIGNEVSALESKFIGKKYPFRELEFIDDIFIDSIFSGISAGEICALLKS